MQSHRVFSLERDGGGGGWWGGDGLKADVNFHTPSDPVRVKVIRIIRFPACEPHREHLPFKGVLTMTGRPRHGGNSAAFFVALPATPGRFPPERMRHTRTKKKKNPSSGTTRLPVGERTEKCSVMVLQCYLPRDPVSLSHALQSL